MCRFQPNIDWSIPGRIATFGIRHTPGALLAFVGLGFCFGNWLTVLFLTVPIIGAFLWRIRIEEHTLIEALGEDYRAYMQRTKRLIPGVY